MPAACCGVSFWMIFEITAALLLVYGLKMLSRLPARLHGVACYVPKSVYGRALWWARAEGPNIQRLPSASKSGSPTRNNRGSSTGRINRHPRRQVRTDYQLTGESVSLGAVGSLSCQPLEEWPAGRIFRPCKRPPLGLQIAPNA
jgi:hypothetical protein